MWGRAFRSRHRLVAGFTQVSFGQAHRSGDDVRTTLGQHSGHCLLGDVELRCDGRLRRIGRSQSRKDVPHRFGPHGLHGPHQRPQGSLRQTSRSSVTA